MPINLGGRRSRPPTPSNDRGRRPTACCTPSASGPGRSTPSDFELEFTTENSTDRPQQVLAHLRGGRGRRGPAPVHAGLVRPRHARPRGAVDRALRSDPRRRDGADHERGDRHLRQGLGRPGGRRSPRRSMPTAASPVSPRRRRCSSGARAASGVIGARRRVPAPAGRRARRRGHLRRPIRPGPAVPAVGRPQSSALRSRVRQAGRVRPAHPARAVHLRVHGPGPAPQRVRFGPDACSRPWRDGSRGRPIPATRSRSRSGTTGTACRFRTDNQRGETVIDAGRFVFS